MNNKKNAISSIILQLATILQGLILPRVILAEFGSEVNGLVSSITQYLGFIALLEGGLGAVVLAELYKPIEEKNTDRIQGILNSCQSFFTKLTGVFMVFTFLVAFIYPRVVDTSFSNNYVAVLVLILSMTTVAQYLFSITYRLYLQAAQQLYIVNIISAVTILVNSSVAILLVFTLKDIHMVKLWSGIVFFVQPVTYHFFVEKKFLRSSIKKSANKYELKDRWSGFAQNFAHFVNLNTDIALITLFMPIESVSVYAVYFLIINALRGVISSVGNSYQSALGKYIVQQDSENLQNKFAKFEESFWLIGMIAFFCCIILINPFVQIYTSGVNDADYYQPIFAFIIVLANMIYVIREPYRLLVLAGGKFRETNPGSIGEAVINLGLSFILIIKFGLIGVAIGTLAAMVFRLCYLLWYLKRDILKKSYSSTFPYFITFFLLLVINLYIYVSYSFSLSNMFNLFIAACVTLALESATCLLIYWCVQRIWSRVSNKFLK